MTTFLRSPSLLSPLNFSLSLSLTRDDRGQWEMRWVAQLEEESEKNRGYMNGKKCRPFGDCQGSSVKSPSVGNIPEGEKMHVLNPTYLWTFDVRQKKAFSTLPEYMFFPGRLPPQGLIQTDWGSLVHACTLSILEYVRVVCMEGWTHLARGKLFWAMSFTVSVYKGAFSLLNQFYRQGRSINWCTCLRELSVMF